MLKVDAQSFYTMIKTWHSNVKKQKLCEFYMYEISAIISFLENMTSVIY